MVLLASLSPLSLTAAEWSRLYQHQPDASGIDRSAPWIRPTLDCGWLLTGGADREVAPSEEISDAWVMKTDAEGQVVWSRAFGGDERDGGLATAPDGTGGHVVLVNSMSFGLFPGLFEAPWIVKLDPQGTIEWQFGYEDEHAYAIAGPVPGGGVLVLGTIDFDLWLIELAPNGDEIRQRKLVLAADTEIGFDLVRTSDGGFLVAGGTESAGAGGTDFWLVKLGHSGAIEWQRAYGTAEDEWIPRVWQTSDGGYLLGGILKLGRDSNNQLITDSLLLRLDPDGFILWARRFDAVGDRPEFTGVVETADGGYMIAHDANPPADIVTHSVLRLLRLDAAGDPIWMREFNHDDEDGSSSLLPLSDGGVMVGGGNRRLIDGVEGGPSNTWLLRLGADGLIGGDGCDLTRDVLVSEVPYDPVATDTDAYLEDVSVGRFATDVVPWVPDIVEIEECSAPGCRAARCGYATAEPYELCEGEEAVLTLSSACGEGAVSIDWDLDGDGVPDDQGQSVQATLPAGTHEVTATVTDSCADPGPGSCRSETTVTVLPSDPPGEVSGPAAPRLRVRRAKDGATRIAVESTPGAAAFNVYADRIGSWYAPTEAKGGACGITSWTDLGAGSVEIDHPLPTDSWVVVTASTPCAEGLAGSDSRGVERTTMGVWDRCGPAP